MKYLLCLLLVIDARMTVNWQLKYLKLYVHNIIFVATLVQKKLDPSKFTKTLFGDESCKQLMYGN